MEIHNYSQYFCSCVVAQFIDAGIDHFFFASGSRSTPMISAIAREDRAQRYLGIDERSIAFMALGYGKCADLPGVVVVTSGTAVANLYPAIVEAFMSSVPMLVITADRPYELRDCGANQTIFQPQMFAQHIIKSFDLAPPSPLVSLSSTLAIFDQAVLASLGPKKGPVHINLQLREPLHNGPALGEPAFSPKALPKKFFGAGQKTVAPDIAQILKIFLEHSRGILVVGELLKTAAQEKILELSTRIGWPIFADVASNLRLTNHPNILSHFDIKLLNPHFLSRLSFTAVVKLGSRVVSKRFWQWIEDHPAPIMLSLNESLDRIDPTGRFEQANVGDLALFLDQILKSLPSISRETSANFKTPVIDSAIAAFLEHGPNNEGYYAARLVARIKEPVSLFLSSGMPIRDVDQFALPTSIPIDIFVNRGASGIDGITSTTAGIATASKKPMIALLGDVAFLHDTNGLMLLKKSPQPILLIVINNGGGGIFHFLPIAKEPEIITPYLDTPHQVELALLCRAHGISHELISEPKQFDRAIEDFFCERSTRVVEVSINRDENVRQHQELYQTVRGLCVS